VLITAFNLGYFDRPKRISTRALAEKLDIRSSTFIAHKIKAERRLLAEVLKES
jgi:predicted DNA binding protein